MNSVVTRAQQNALGPISSLAASYLQSHANALDELGSGVTGGFAVISYRGKVWRIKHRGEERNLMRADGDGARSSIEVVIVKASPVISKIFYKDGYEEGSTAAPDCWSTNGVTPDSSVQTKQCATCAGCPMNAWGSRVSTATGKPGKACSDSKRLAVVPVEDIANEMFGGPMLLRVPAASLGDMKSYGERLSSFGYPPFAVGTRISFDVDQAFPKFVFAPTGALSDEQVKEVLELRESPEVSRILNEAIEHATAEPAEQPKTAQQAEVEDAFAALAPKAAAPAKPAAPAAAAAQPKAAAPAKPAAPAVAAAPAKPARPAVDIASATDDDMPGFLKRNKAPAAPAPVAAAPEPEATEEAAPDDFDSLLESMLS